MLTVIILFLFFYSRRSGIVCIVDKQIIRHLTASYGYALERFNGIMTYFLDDTRFFTNWSLWKGCIDVEPDLNNSVLYV